MDKQYNSWCEWFTDTQMNQAPEEKQEEVKADGKTKRKPRQATKEAKD